MFWTWERETEVTANQTIHSWQSTMNADQTFSLEIHSLHSIRYENWIQKQFRNYNNSKCSKCSLLTGLSVLNAQIEDEIEFFHMLNIFVCLEVCIKFKYLRIGNVFMFVMCIPLLVLHSCATCK